MRLSADLRKALITGAIITAASVTASVVPVWVWLQLDPVIDAASIYISCIVLPALIAPSCSFFILRAQMRAEKLARENDRLAHSDQLTGLPNRRAFFQAAEALKTQARTGEGIFFCAIADIDHFKLVNDEFGHDAGDAVLRSVGRLLQAAAPAGGIAARFGGEEFALAGVLPSELAARGVFNAVVAGVRQSETDHGGTRICVTVSLGYAAAEPGESVSAVISRADHALYEAKRGGRNQAISAKTATQPLRPAPSTARRAQR